MMWQCSVESKEITLQVILIPFEDQHICLAIRYQLSVLKIIRML